MSITRRSFLAASVAAVTIPSLPGRVAAQNVPARYTLELIVPLDGCVSTKATGISRGGWVSGSSIDLVGYKRRVILYRDGVVRDRSIPEVELSEGFGVNKSAVVVGYQDFFESTGRVAGVWDGSEYIALPSLGAKNSVARKVNDEGIVVGTSLRSDGNWFACKWVDREVIQLQTPLLYSDAFGVNRRGDIVGAANVPGDFDNEDTRGALWVGDEIFLLGTLGGAHSSAHAINDHGQIAGNALISGDVPLMNVGTHAFLWQDDAMIDLGAYSGGAFSAATDINNDGWVVGYSHNPAANPNDRSDFRSLAVLWANGELINLNDRIDDTQGWLLVRAAGINDSGQIAGVASNGTVTRGFVLTPVEE